MPKVKDYFSSPTDTLKTGDYFSPEEEETDISAGLLPTQPPIPTSGVVRADDQVRAVIEDAKAQTSVMDRIKGVGSNILEVMATGRGAEVLGEPDPLGVDIFSPFRPPVKEFGVPDPKQQTLAQQIEGVITGGVEKWREATEPTQMAEVKPYSLEEVDAIVSNLAKGVASVPRLAFDIPEQIFLDEEGKPRKGADIAKSAAAVGGEFATFPLTVFSDYALYLSPLSTAEQRGGAVERIAEHPEGLPFAVAIIRGGFKGAKRFKRAVEKTIKKEKPSPYAERLKKIRESEIPPRVEDYFTEKKKAVTSYAKGRLIGERAAKGKTLIVPEELEPYKQRPPAFPKRPSVTEVPKIEGGELVDRGIIKVAEKTPKRRFHMEQLESIDGEVVRVGKRTPRVFHKSHKGWVEYRTQKAATPKLVAQLDEFVKPPSKIVSAAERVIRKETEVPPVEKPKKIVVGKKELATKKALIEKGVTEEPAPAGKGKAGISDVDLKTTANEMLNDAKYIQKPRVAKGTPAMGVQVDYSAAAPKWYAHMRSGTGMGKAETLTGLRAIIKDGAATKNVHGQRLLSYVEGWAQRKPGKGAGEMVAAEFKAGDRVRIGDEWYEAKISEKTGEVKLIDSQSVTMDVFDKVKVDEFRPASVAARPAKQAELAGLQRAEAEAMTTGKMKKVTGTKAIKEEILGRPEGEVLPGQEKLGFKKTISEKLESAEKAAYERIKKRGTRLTAGIDPAEVADLAIIGAAKIGRGTIKFAEWSAEMVKEFGDRVKPHLKAIYARSQQETPRFKANAEIDSFVDYFENIQAPAEFRPPRKPARTAIRERLREEGLRGKELTRETDAEFTRAVHYYGIALRKTKGGKVQPSIREAGTFVPEGFATYTEFKDAKAGVFGGTKDATRFIQEIDGALSVEAKAKLSGQAGPAERYVLHRTRDIVKSKLNWTGAMKSRLVTISKDLSKKQLEITNQVIEHISRKGAYVDPAKLVTNPKISALTTDLNVIRFAQESRKLYESLLRHQNELRRLRGQKKIRHRNYFTVHSLHEATIWERALGHNKTPEQIVGPGLPDYIKPNAPFNPRAMARKLGLPETAREMNLKVLLERYIETAARDIFNTSIVQNNKAFIQQLKSMGYEHAARGLENWTAEAFTGVKATVDRAAGLSPTIHKGMNRFRRGLIRSVFPLNFAWNSFVQTSSGVLTVTRYGVRNSVKGLYDWFGNKAIRQEIRDNAYSAIIKSQRSGRISQQDINRGVGAAERLNRGKLEKVSDAANFFTEWVERHLTGWSVATAKRHGASAGLKGKALWEYASDGGAKTQSMYNLEDLPGMLRSEVVKTAAPFQTFSFEVFNTLREFAGKTGTPPATAAIRIKQVLRFLAGATAVNYIGQAAIGRKPWELSSFIPFYGTFIAPVAAALRGGDVSQATTRGLPSPIGIAIKGGQAVHRGLLKPGVAATKELIRTGDMNEALEEFMVTGKWDKLRRFTIRYLSGFAGLPGGTQMNRVVDGLIAVSAGGMVDSTDKLMFPITDTKDKIRSFLAGPWASEGGQEYWDKRGKELNLDIEFMEENPFLRDVVESIPVVGDLYKLGKDSESQVRQDIQRMLRTGDTHDARQKRREWNRENPDNKISVEWYNKIKREHRRMRRKEGSTE